MSLIASGPGDAADRPRLRRRLGTLDAVAIGLGSMLGAGVFAAFAPAAAAAGSWLLAGLGIAAVVATANALASAQLAAQYPAAGGTYHYGREVLGPWWGYLAGWAFVVGKTASCAAMALTFAAYTVPEPWQRPIAAAAVLALAIVNSLGVTRTALAAKVLVVGTLAALALVVLAGLSGPPPAPLGDALASAPGPFAVLQSAGLLFFAFAGYARVATLGEEVRDPARVIPRAIVVALAVALLVYLLVGIAALRVLPVGELAESVDPLAAVVAAAGWDAGVPVVRAGAALASLGALLALIAGVGRTAFAMARDAELPAVLARIHPRSRVPHVAELALGVVVAVVVLLADVRGAIAFSSFGVLLYYLIANVAALRQPAAQRRFPRALQVIGAVGCAALVGTLPVDAVLVGAAVVAAGAVIRLVRLGMRRARDGRLSGR